MRALKNFIFYNNTVPLVFGVLFLGTSLTFAASEDAREVVVRSESVLSSVDNTFIRNVDLDSYGIEVFVNSVAEDDDFYYVSYTVNSIGLVDGVWKPSTEERELQISKEALGDNDLGVRVSKELSDVYTNERRILRETQAIEKEIGSTEKIITTKYDGIVGRMLDPENEVFPGYDPVVTPPPAIPGELPKKEKQFETTTNDGKQVVIENQGTPQTTAPTTDQGGTAGTSTSPVNSSSSTPTTTNPVTVPTPAPTTTTPTTTDSAPTESTNPSEDASTEEPETATETEEVEQETATSETESLTATST